MNQLSQELSRAIETPRLSLRSPSFADAEGIFDAYAQDPDVARYMVWRPHASLETTRSFIAGCVASWEAGTALPYVLSLKAS